MSQLRPLATGDVFMMRGGDTVEVIHYHNASEVVVEFTEYRKYRSTVSKKEIVQGYLRNAYKPTIYGRGYIGVGEYYGAANKFEYATWWGMFRRCYDEQQLIKNPTYQGCIVDEKWYNFQVFTSWLVSRKQAGLKWMLDKDLLYANNRLYSEDTCCLLPSEINTFLAYSRSGKRGSEFPGVYWDKKSSKYRSVATFRGNRKTLGLSLDPEELFFLYKREKEAQAKILAGDWKELLDKNAYEALMCWQLRFSKQEDML